MEDETAPVKFIVTCLSCGKTYQRTKTNGLEAIDSVGECTVCGARDFRAEPQNV